MPRAAPAPATADDGSSTAAAPEPSMTSVSTTTVTDPSSVNTESAGVEDAESYQGGEPAQPEPGKESTAEEGPSLSRRFSENHLCGAKELFARPRKFFRISPPLSVETRRKSAENPVFWARVSFFCPRLRFFTQDRPFCMARELILATIDD